MTNLKHLINWKLFGILLVACVLSVIAVLPYTLTLQGDLLKGLPISLYALLVAQILQNVLIFALFIFVGLYLGERVSLGVPILEGWLNNEEVKPYFKSILGISILSGVGAGVLIIVLDIVFGIIHPLKIAQTSAVIPPAWQGFLASFYGGIGEEVAMRLCLMTLLAWVFWRIKSTREGTPTNEGMWLAIVGAAVIFGLGHLPTTAAVMEITPFIVARAVILNGVGGVIFGWLYWKKGLESAMISHFSVDIVLHVLLPLLI